MLLESRRTGRGDFYIWSFSETCFSVSKTLVNIRISIGSSSLFYKFGVIKDKKKKKRLWFGTSILIVWVPLLKEVLSLLDVRLKEFMLEESLSLVFLSRKLTCPYLFPEGRTRAWNRRVGNVSVRSQVGWWVSYDYLCYVLISEAFLISMPVF